MKQNIYDNPDFFGGYMELRSSERGFNSAIEEPAVYSLMPSLEGLRVLGLGAGHIHSEEIQIRWRDDGCCDFINHGFSSSSHGSISG